MRVASPFAQFPLVLVLVVVLVIDPTDDPGIAEPGGCPKSEMHTAEVHVDALAGGIVSVEKESAAAEAKETKGHKDDDEKEAEETCRAHFCLLPAKALAR